jgi:hypothetical protein
MGLLGHGGCHGGGQGVGPGVPVNHSRDPYLTPVLSVTCLTLRRAAPRAPPVSSRPVWHNCGTRCL